MSHLSFEYVKGRGLQVKIDKDDLEELMKQDRLDEKRRDDLDYIEQCNNDRTIEQQEKFDSGVKGSEFN